MKRRIFLADDSITIQKVVELTFAGDAYEVICAGSGTLALERIASTSPDIALVDVHMPDLSGYDVCARLRQNEATAWMPVLLLTGAFESYDEPRAKEAGADGQLRKPFESRSLLARVEEMLAAKPRPGQPAPAPPPARIPAPGLSSSEFFARVPPGPAEGSAAPAPVPAAPAPDAAVEKAAREAVAAVAEKIVREIAWEVIPDLAEALVRRRLQELEAAAERDE